MVTIIRCKDLNRESCDDALESTSSVNLVQHKEKKKKVPPLLPRVELIFDAYIGTDASCDEWAIGQSNLASASTSSNSPYASSSWTMDQVLSFSSRSEEKEKVKNSLMERCLTMQKQLTGNPPADSNWRQRSSEAIARPKCQADALIDISREPIYCPQCNKPIGTTSLLNHFLNEHINKRGSHFIEIFLRYRCVQVIDPMSFELYKNKVVSLFAYGGEQHNVESSFIRRSLAIPNDKLPDAYVEYQDFLPVVLIICRTTTLAYAKGDDLKSLLKDKVEDTRNHLWVIWLAAPKTLNPLSATITVYNDGLKRSISRIVQVRDVSESQECFKFICNGADFMDLSYTNVKYLSMDFTKSISIEVIFNEC